mmetsp:Transcript_3772/g.8041  ORF Transcript_3772/g.8041 Transcript_3772/m.8041 type:complete len:208 (-) Transcript_3772:54-677(-)
MIECPRPPGSYRVLPPSHLAPITVEIDGQEERFLWDASNTDLLSEFSFAIQLLGDLGISLPRHLLLARAFSISQQIRQQVQEYREVMGARHCGQGLPGEQLVTVEVQGELIQWDLACPENSPEAFAMLYAVDHGKTSAEALLIAHELRSKLKAYQRKLTDVSNITLLKVTPTPQLIRFPPALDAADLPWLRESIPPPPDFGFKPQID